MRRNWATVFVAAVATRRDAGDFCPIAVQQDLVLKMNGYGTAYQRASECCVGRLDSATCHMFSP